MHEYRGCGDYGVALRFKELARTIKRSTPTVGRIFVLAHGEFSGG
jgi:hypothetical protein